MTVMVLPGSVLLMPLCCQWFHVSPKTEKDAIRCTFAEALT
jgi:hypothetical protein